MGADVVLFEENMVVFENSPKIRVFLLGNKRKLVETDGNQAITQGWGRGIQPSAGPQPSLAKTAPGGPSPQARCEKKTYFLKKKKTV